MNRFFPSAIIPWTITSLILAISFLFVSCTDLVEQEDVAPPSQPEGGFADFNGDGCLDKWKLGNSRRNQVPLWVEIAGSDCNSFKRKKNWSHQNGDDTFGKSINYKTGVADFNGDKKADIWQLSRPGREPFPLYVWITNDTGDGFNPYESWGMQNGHPTFGRYNSHATMTTDFNGDGKADMFQLPRTGPPPVPLAVWITNDTGDGFNPYESWGMQNGHPTFGPTHKYPTYMLDFNKDGRTDFWQEGDNSTVVAYWQTKTNGKGFEPYINIEKIKVQTVESTKVE